MQAMPVAAVTRQDVTKTAYLESICQYHWVLVATQVGKDGIETFGQQQVTRAASRRNVP